jgi:hypothetical protein
MANFPALRPATVQITPGTVPTTLTAGYDGSTTTSTADLVPTGDVLDMTFEGITEAEARGVVDHQDGEEGRAFQFTSTTLATGLTPAGYRWTYAQPISQDDIRAVAGSEFYRLSIRFLGVRVRRSSTPSATATLQLRTTAAKALPAGTPSASATLRLTTTAAGMATGTPAQSAFLLLRTTPANVKVPTGEDPYFDDNILLCGFNGANGSQTFVDEGPLNLSLSAIGNAQISTEQSVFGGSSLKLTQPNIDSPASGVQLPIDSRLVVHGEFTLDARVRLLNVRRHTILGNSPGNLQIGLDSGENNIFMHYEVGEAYESYNVNATLNTWLALRYTRALNANGTGWIYYYFANGNLIMARDSGLLGSLNFSGGRIGVVPPSTHGLHGYIDELRLGRVCRGITAYTVDTAPFPRT